MQLIWFRTLIAGHMFLKNSLLKNLYRARNISFAVKNALRNILPKKVKPLIMVPFKNP